MKFIIPSDFADAVETKTGEPFNVEQAEAMLEVMLAHAAGRALCGNLLLPSFLAYLEDQAKRCQGEEFASPRIMLMWPGVPTLNEVSA